MTTDQMRAEFETWADAKCLPLTRIKWKDGSVSEYAYTATFDAWQVWQDAYAAGREAEREACFRCDGSGWCWCDEMPNRAGHEPAALVVDDTRYTCPDCGGSGKTKPEGEQ